MRYIPNTEEDRRAMLEAVGVDSVDALFDASIPKALQLDRALEVPSGMGEADLLAHMRRLAARNITGTDAISLLGGGVYRHYVPTAVSQLLLRGELYTAYTPYQPEIAQGTLQIIFEFQTMIAQLLEMEVVNASMYDGSTAMAEAALMALRVKSKRSRVVVSRALHPEYRDVTRLYVESNGSEIVEVPYAGDGRTDLDAAAERLADGAAALIVGYPTCFGTVDDLVRARALCDEHDALLIVVFQEAMAFGVLAPPGAFGADIVCGEGQSLGVAQSFGGPHLGLFATKTEFLRQMPGRIAGQTVDSRGNRGFVLTMATREQHIRRERATSNICTNQGLMATASTIYMTLMGPGGLATAARACHARAEEAKAAFTALDGYGLVFDAPTFHEFVLRTPRPAQAIVDALSPRRIAPGIPLSRWLDGVDDALLVTATELTTSDEIAAVAEALAEFA